MTPGQYIQCITLALAVACLGMVSSAQEDAGETLRISVRMVMIDTQVLNAKTGRAIGPLEPRDFQVYEDGIQQKIISFSQDELPLSVVFLFDLTDSVRPVLKSLASGSLQALHRLRPNDEVAVMVYSASAEVLQDFTTDRQLAADAILKASKMESGEAAFFNEGIFQAAVQSARSKIPSSRRVVLWMTDNVPNIPSEEIRQRYGRSISSNQLHTKNQATAELLKSGSVVYTLLRTSEISDQMALHTSANIVSGMLYPPGDVYQYSQLTGGRVIESSAKKMESMLVNWIDEIRTRYTLGYRPPPGKSTGKFCKIEVKLSPDVRKREGRLLVEARHGYYR